MKRIVKVILSVLWSRLARNIYLWVILIWLVLELNAGNEQEYHHGAIYSPWYKWLIIGGALIQMMLLYGTLWVTAPRYLGKGKVFRYLGVEAAFGVFVSLCTVALLKWIDPHMPVEHLQQVSYTSSPVANDWQPGHVLEEVFNYFAGNMLWMLLATMYWYTQDYYRQQKVFAEAEKKRTETELHFLKSQINPHFLFNTLNNIYGLALKKSDATPDVLLKLSAILRYLLYESNTALVSFEKEKEIMQAYIDLELLRLEQHDSFRFHIEADGEYRIPPLLWLPVLENIFKHGTRVIASNYFIDFRFTILNGRMTIYGSNNYKALPASNTEGGIGLENLKKRLDLLYPGTHRVDISRDEHTFTIVVETKL